MRHRWLFHSLALALVSLPAFAQEADFSVPFIDQTLQRSDDFYSNGMNSLVDDVIKITGLTDEAKAAALKEAAKGAVADKMAKSKTGLWKVWTSMGKRNGDVDQTQFWNAYRKLPEAILTPDRSPIWTEALQRVLSKPELAKWEAEATIRRERIEKAIADYLDRGRETWKDQRVEARKPQAEELVSEHQLDETSAQRLRSGIEPAVRQSLPSWGKGLEKTIREYVKSAFLGGAEDRLRMLEGGQINFGNAAEPEALAAEESCWKELLKQVLTPQGYAAFEDRELKRSQKRNRALTLLAVSEVDRHLKLTPSQRGRLEGLLGDVIQTARPKIDTMMTQNYTSSEFILMVLNGVPESNVAGLLESEQKRTWDDLASRYEGWWNQN